MTEQHEPPRLIAYCHWHNGLSDTARLVQIDTAGKRFACERCRITHNLAQLADQP